MPKFLEDIRAFYGTKEKNEMGQNLENFLEEYNPKKYDNPCVTADILVFKHKESFHAVETGLKLLMIKRKNHPSIGYWALPGGFVEIREDLETAARRELEEETHLSGIAMEQIYTWGEYWRDPRARIITTAFLALVDESIAPIEAGDDAEDAAWMDVTLKEIEVVPVVINQRKKLKSVFHLVLENEEKHVILNAKVEQLKNAEGLLEETNFQVLEKDGMAFDHPRFIVQALLYLREKLKS
jgi:8-oxo-dGTP diphosphatase